MANVDIKDLLDDCLGGPTGVSLRTNKRHLSKLATQYRHGNVSKRQIDAAYGRPQDGGKWITRTWNRFGVTV